MSETKESSSIADLISIAQLQKIELEIQQLRSNKGWPSRIGKYVPLITSIVAVAGFLTGILTFNAQKEKDYKQFFWEKQLLTYNEIVNSAARLSTLENEDDVNKEYQHFKELYHGSAVLYMDDSVANALKTFVETYIDYQNNPKMQITLQEKSRILSNKCRLSLQKNWNIPLKDINLSRFH